MGKIYDFIGQTFGRLTVLEKLHQRGNNGCVLWRCVCNCKDKTEVVKTTGDLVSGNTRSCGCFRKENTSAMFKKHGLESSPEYGTWLDIKKRCYNRNYKQYPDYGGRGILMSDEWKNDFQAFYRDMGPRPSPEHSIDRKDNELGYSKSNCRWATYLEQANNKRANIRYKLNNKEYTIAELARMHTMPYATMRIRLLLMPIEQAVVSSIKPAHVKITLNGITEELGIWVKERKLSAQTVVDRLDDGWTMEEALEAIHLRIVEFEGQTVSLATIAELLGYSIKETNSFYLRILRGETIEQVVKNI